MPYVSAGLGDGAGTTRGGYAIVHSCCKRQCMSSFESKWASGSSLLIRAMLDGCYLRTLRPAHSRRGLAACAGITTPLDLQVYLREHFRSPRRMVDTSPEALRIGQER